MGLRTEKVLKALARATDPKHHATVAHLLKVESDSAPTGLRGPWGAKTEEEAQVQALRLARVRALMELLGTEKIRKPSLLCGLCMPKTTRSLPLLLQR